MNTDWVLLVAVVLSWVAMVIAWVSFWLAASRIVERGD